jgi:predicted DNA-binding WGR domain protein
MAVIQEDRYIYVEQNDEENSNKYWNIELHDNGNVVTTWGRTGVTKNSKTFPGAGEKFYQKKIREKEKGGYTPQRIVTGAAPVNNTRGFAPRNNNLEDIALRQIRTNDDEVKKLISYLAKSNIHNIVSNTKIEYNEATGLFTTPLGLVTKAGIDEARELLSAIKTDLETENTDTQTFNKHVTGYLRVIPRNIGMKKVQPISLFPNIEEVLKQNDILDSLESSLTEATKIKGKDGEETEPKLFDVELSLVTDRDTLRRVENLYNQTRGGYRATISNVYRVDLVTMREAFEKAGKNKGNLQQLWHGTSKANILSILKNGLTITPPATANITTRAFGGGVYFAIHANKSLIYSSRRNFDSKLFMFLNDVTLGQFYVPKSSTSSPPPKGYDCYWAKPGETLKLGGRLDNDEIIIFDPAQINPVYLVQFEN